MNRFPADEVVEIPEIRKVRGHESPYRIVERLRSAPRGRAVVFRPVTDISMQALQGNIYLTARRHGLAVSTRREGRSVVAWLRGGV